MKRIITISSSGACAVESPPEFRPPLGLTLPAGQDTQTSIPSARTFGTLFASADPSPVPDGVEVHIGSKRYEYVGGVPLDADTFEDVSASAIAGTIVLRNLTTYDIGITW